MVQEQPWPRATWEDSTGHEEKGKREHHCLSTQRQGAIGAALPGLLQKSPVQRHPATFIMTANRGTYTCPEDLEMDFLAAQKTARCARKEAIICSLP